MIQVRDHVNKESGIIEVILSPALCETRNYFIQRNNKNQWPVIFSTATSDMTDFIGNVVSIDDGKCTVKGHFRGKDVEAKNVIAKGSYNVGDRTMVTEHLNLDGHLELIATKFRILQQNINFINYGWSDEKESKYLCIDIYTGECRIKRGESING